MASKITQLLDLAEYEIAEQLIAEQIARGSYEGHLYKCDLLLRKGEYQSAFEYAQNICDPEQSQIYQIRNKKHIGEALLRLGRLHEAFVSLEEAKQQYEKNPKYNIDNAEYSNYYADILNNLGLTSREQNKREQAHEFFILALQYYPTTYINERAAVYNNLALLHADMSDYEYSLAEYRKAEAIFTQTGDKKKLAAVCNNMGIVYRNMSKLEAAEQYIARSLELNREIDNKPQIAQTLNSLAAIHAERGDNQKALVLFEESLKIKREVGNTLEILLAEINIGFAHQELGNFAKAVEIYEHTLQQSEDIQQIAFSSYILHNLGNIYRETGEMQLASKIYSKALHIQQQTENKQGIASSLQNLGLVAYAMGEFTDAENKLQQAHQLAIEIGNINLQARIDFNICMMAIHSHNPQLLQIYWNELQRLINQDNPEIALRNNFLQAIQKKREIGTVFKKDTIQMLEELLQENLSYSLRVQVSIHLSDMLLENIYISGNVALLQRVQEILYDIYIHSVRRNNYVVIIESLKLQSKIALLQGSYEKAKHLLLNAEEICAGKQLKHLGEVIAKELQMIQNQKSMMRELINSNASLDQRIKQSGLNAYVEEILKRKSLLQ